MRLKHVGQQGKCRCRSLAAMEQVEARRLLAHYAFSKLGLVNEDGNDPTDAPVVVDASGDVFGTEAFGGANGNGEIFEVAKGSGKAVALVSFGALDSDFGNPSHLLMDAKGDLFGAAVMNLDSEIFEVKKGSGTLTTLVTIKNEGAEGTPSSLIMDAKGDLFGTTEEGGTENFGTIFELAAGSSTITTLASFGSAFRIGSSGGEAVPPSVTAVDQSGNLYGVAGNGGPDRDGSVFELHAGGDAVKTLATFDGSNGSFPLGVVLDRNGNLLGTADGDSDVAAAPEQGTIFEIVKGSGTVTTLANFDGTDEAVCESPPTIDSAGDLFGTTEGDEFDQSDEAASKATDNGAVFELAAGSHTITTLQAFYGSNGEYPQRVALDASGNIYGVTAMAAPDEEDKSDDLGDAFELAVTTKVGNLAVQSLDDVGAPARSMIEILTAKNVALEKIGTTAAGTRKIDGFPAGSYNLDLFSPDGKELWATGTAVIVNGKTTKVTLRRQEPYAYSVSVVDVDNDTNVTGQTVTGGTPLEIDVRVRNGTGAAQDTSAGLDLTYDAGLTVALNSGLRKRISAGGSVDFSFAYTPEASVQFDANVTLSVSLNAAPLETFSASYADLFGAVTLSMH